MKGLEEIISCLLVASLQILYWKIIIEITLCQKKFPGLFQILKSCFVLQLYHVNEFVFQKNKNIDGNYRITLNESLLHFMKMDWNGKKQIEVECVISATFYPKFLEYVHTVTFQMTIKKRAQQK
ncbi:hypothetical protein RFI_04324 [Reticulomyxa filosa]|uniref:Uncharacterized protein n=1 Tax=Reticulomyxa filosa TaxID=46433 RepID=X6P3L2_RETFI|nr:hypothetical protein RFI_04324 [Reticulomyxa filosa]|eukprot:ETO32791.1 hypothetical protein RFI_04324 [Reticulomyxa filosa]